MYQENIVLCGASSYEQKYYFNPDFNSLPESIKQELQIMCVLYTEDIGGILTLEFDEDGNQTGMDPTPVQVQADSVIISISQGPKSKLVNTTEGLKASENGLLVTNSFGETTHPGIFAAGDVVLGAKTVVQATAYAKQVAEAMDKYMRGELEVPEAEMSAAEVPAAKAPTADAPEQA